MNKFFVRGLGFFNDAYDLFIMNVINVVLTEQYGKDVYTSNLKSAVSAAALIGAVIGQIAFGILGDVFGRKTNMVATCALLIVGGVLCTGAHASTPTGTIWFLVLARGLLGIGIGGEYPLAASSTAEDATNVEERNARVALTFSLQGIGSLMASLVGNLLVQSLANGQTGDNDPQKLEVVWRLLFGIGIIPALIVCHHRLFAEETEAYKATQERQRQARNEGASSNVGISFIFRHYWKSLLGTAGCWFLFDIAFYAQNLFSASILSVVGLRDPSLQQITLENVFIALMGLPGYYVACFFINRLGRRLIQLQGFFLQSLLFLCLAFWWEDLKINAILFIILFGCTLFFANFGPNTTTFVLPTEMYPTQIRGTCHGISAASGKVGAAIGSFGFSIWVEDKSFGYPGAFYTFAALTFVSIPLTWFCTFDNDRGLDALDKEFHARVMGTHPNARDSVLSRAKSTKSSSFMVVCTPEYS